MANRSVILLDEQGGEHVVTEAPTFVYLAYGRGWTPKMGTTQQAYLYLVDRGAAPEPNPNRPVTATELEDELLLYLPRSEYTPGGGGAGAAKVHNQSIALATWSITHTLGRLPSVAIYVNGVHVEADVSVTTTTVSISFPSPTAGFAVLT